MTSKREKLQYAYVFFADLLTMAVSVLLAWLITDGLFGVLIPYTSTDWLQTLCLLFVAFVVTFFFFDQDKNIVTRSENEEISLSLRFNIAFGLVYAGCMLLAKATMLDSRYFAVTVPAVNAVLLPFSHAILKRLLIRFQRSWGMETLVGVVTTSDRAERLISEIRKDWSRRVVGVSLLEATPAAVSTRVCGVEVKATFDDFMDWIRREALDEVAFARARGQRVYVETCPQYLALDDGVYYDANWSMAARYVCAPPIRAEENQRALWRGLRRGEIQTISTDHCSFTLAQKDMGREDFTKIPGGLPGVETRGEVVYTRGVAAGRMTVAGMCRALCENPAKLYGLYPRKGVIAAGSDADIVVYDPKASHILSARDMVTKAGYTPFEGLRTEGGIAKVYLRGSLMVEDGRIVGGPEGQYLRRGLCTL